MEIKTREIVQVQVLLDEQDLSDLEQDPMGTVIRILKAAGRGIGPSSPVLESQDAVAKAGKKGRHPCPFPGCGEPIKQQGLGVHFARKHATSYQKWVARQAKAAKRGKKPAPILPEPAKEIA